MVQFLTGKSIAVKKILKINNSWTELFNFQNSFNCHTLELLRLTLSQMTNFRLFQTKSGCRRQFHV